MYHSMVIETIVTGAEVDYVAVCVCGFEGLPTSDRDEAKRQQCEVLAAEIEGRKRRARRRDLAKSA